MASQKSQHEYRGHKIEIEKTERATRLFIDGHEVDLERTPGGYISHAFMFKEFGTPYELAEELIKQWGEAEIKHSPGGHPHHPHQPHQ